MESLRAWRMGLPRSGLVQHPISISLRKPLRRSRGSGNPVNDSVLLDSRLRGNDGEIVPSALAARQRAAGGGAEAPKKPLPATIR
jgi:hypothetical protein